MTNEELVRAYQNGDECAFESLIKQNKSIIHRVQNKWDFLVIRQITTWGELYSECLFALWKAAKEYKQDAEYKFITYAFKAMDWHVNRYFTKERKKNGKMKSLDAVIPGTDDMTLADLLPDENATAELESIFDVAANADLQKRLIQICQELLTPIQQEVLFNNYGIGCLPSTLDQLAMEWDCTKQAVHSVKQTAIQKLRNTRIIRQLADEHMLTICTHRRKNEDADETVTTYRQGNINTVFRRAKIC